MSEISDGVWVGLNTAESWSRRHIELWCGKACYSAVLQGEYGVADGQNLHNHQQW